MNNVFFVTIFIVPAAAWRGYVLSYLWAWFVVPAFGLPAISVLQALGLALLVGMTTHEIPNEKENNDNIESSWGYVLAAAFLNPALALAMGWVVMRLM